MNATDAMTDTHDTDADAEAQFKTDSIDDLEELLARAGNLAEGDLGAAVLAAEFRQARAYVADELADEVALADGGER